MKAEKLLLELEEIVTSNGFRIRKEKGNFRSDHCLVEGDQVVVLNKLHPYESQVGILARLIFDYQLTNNFIKPKVRKALEIHWKNSDYYDPEEFEFEETQE